MNSNHHAQLAAPGAVTHLSIHNDGLVCDKKEFLFFKKVTIANNLGFIGVEAG